MLGPLARKLFFKGYIWGTYLYFVPYVWDRKTKQLHDIRAIQMYGSQNESPLQMSYSVISVVMFLCSLLPVAFQCNQIRVRHQMPAFNFQYIMYAEKYQEKYMLKVTESKWEAIQKDTPGLIMFFLYYISLVVLALFLLIAAVYPDLPCLLTSLTIVKEFLPWKLFIALAVVQWIVVCSYLLTWFGIMYLYAFTSIDVLFAALEVPREMTLGRSSYTTSCDLRNDEDLLELYGGIRVLYQNGVDVLCVVVLPANKWLFLSWCVYCIYGFLKLEGLFALIMFVAAITLMVYLAFVFSALAKVPQCSEEMLQSWRGRPHSKRVWKSIKSLKPLNIPVGPFYSVDKGMVINMFRFILESTVDLIMFH